MSILKNFKTIKINKTRVLNKDERADFITLYKSGKYYLKELCEMFDITYHQAKKEIQAYEERRKKYGN